MQVLADIIRFRATAWLLLLMLPWGPVAVASTQTTQPPLKRIHVDTSDRTALRAGALLFMNRCLSCHSVQGARFTELTTALGLSRKQVERYLNLTPRRVTQTIVSSMPADVAMKFLNKAPPDLTVIAKRRSLNWLYTYLTSFYVDPSRPTGVNNVVFYNVAMPDVFASLQGLQAPVKKAGYRFGKPAQVAVGVKPLTQGRLSHERFDTMVGDIVAFLDYLAHPHRQARHNIGPWILGLLALFTLFAGLLYRSYWRRVVRPEGGRWWHYRARW
jgi:ubiquinol-cytochrome c reductase cytochrome c1 subunit